jgi:membrane protein YqaA with SNARE-associated domain
VPFASGLWPSPLASLGLLTVASWGRGLIKFFVRLGVFGPLLLETLDSSFFYVPVGTELLLFALVHGEGARWMWIVYALSAAVGSVMGVLLLDRVVRRIGREGVERLVKPRRFEKLKRRMGTRTGWVVFLASVLPPPFPFRVTMMTASALQCPRPTILLSVFAGRTLRFSAEALLILYFGRAFLRVMDSEAFEYVIYALVLVAAAGSLLLIYRLFKSRGRLVAPSPAGD